jgi:hypothetical protein
MRTAKNQFPHPPGAQYVRRTRAVTYQFAHVHTLPEIPLERNEFPYAATVAVSGAGSEGSDLLGTNRSTRSRVTTTNAALNHNTT